MTFRTFIAAAIAVLGIAGISLGERGGDFSVEQKLTASDAAAGDYYGYSVSVSGTTAIVGASQEDGTGADSGSAYIIERDANGSFNEIAKLTASDPVPGGYFGYSVAISGDIALVGSVRGYYFGVPTGSAYVFERQADGGWIETEKLNSSDAFEYDSFGHSVAIDGDICLIGAIGDDDTGSGSGSAYIYERQGDGSWIQLDKLTALDGDEWHRFGSSVSITGNVAMVGAEEAGRVYVYERQENNSWSEIQILDSSDGTSSDKFGNSVSVSGNTAIIGAIMGNGNFTGSAYIFERQKEGGWNEIQKLDSSDQFKQLQFGDSVSISGETAVVGVSGDDELGAGSGSMYMYERDNTGMWNETRVFTASDGAEGDRFGKSVSISGDMALIGAYLDDDHGSFSGSAYIFSSPPPPANGACCAPTGCEILTLEQCSNMGGVFMAGESCEQCDPVCLADINGDGTVGVDDLLAVIGAWGLCP